MPLANESSAATPDTVIRQEVTDPKIARLNIPGPAVYEVLPGQGSAAAVVCRYDFLKADEVKANRVEPTWSSPDLVLAEYGLELVRETARRVLQEIFSDAAAVTTTVEPSAESHTPELIFHLQVPRAMRDRRMQFLDRYVREIALPAGSIVPVLLWSYFDGNSA
jgi:hypothetical protein